MTASQRIQRWPNDSREAAQLVIDKYGEPDEATDSQLVWHKRGEEDLKRAAEEGQRKN